MAGFAKEGFNMYYPPEWRPECGDLDKFHGGHKLRDQVLLISLSRTVPYSLKTQTKNSFQAKKIDQGILDVRIELPFPIWCLGCQRKFAMGVRYTAEKFMVGKYLSTPIYKFKMKCHMCPQMLEMRTDPKNFEYLCVSGNISKLSSQHSETFFVTLLPYSKSDFVRLNTF